MCILAFVILLYFVFNFYSLIPSLEISFLFGILMQFAIGLGTIRKVDEKVWIKKRFSSTYIKEGPLRTLLLIIMFFFRSLPVQVRDNVIAPTAAPALVQWKSAQ